MKINSWFTLENIWLNFEGFVVQLKEWWTSYNVQDKDDVVLANKLWAVRIILRFWEFKRSQFV